MGITPYQINNVLRVYGEQLRRGRVLKRQRFADTNKPDKISISVKVRQESIVTELNDNAENTVLRKLESEHEKPLPNNAGRHYGLIFKEVDENGETINSFSVENSILLTNKLKESTNEVVEKNMG